MQTMAPNGNNLTSFGPELVVPSRIYSTLDGNGRPHDGNQVNWAILGVLLPCQNTNKVVEH